MSVILQHIAVQESISKSVPSRTFTCVLQDAELYLLPPEPLEGKEGHISIPRQVEAILPLSPEPTETSVVAHQPKHLPPWHLSPLRTRQPWIANRPLPADIGPRVDPVRDLPYRRESLPPGQNRY